MASLDWKMAFDIGEHDHVFAILQERTLALAHMLLQWCFAQEVGSAGGCILQKALSLRASQITEKESKRASYSPTATAKHRALSVSEDHPQARAKSK